ncbi:MAG: hypothetical protein B7733_04540 [Myxococcales bacterium FL481]|nr:MAG: hypothetical protein B7733_04540 [Myxococcales bacterium FL481]
MRLAEHARGWLAALLLSSAGACQATPVSARAVWLDVVRGDGQPRTIHVYDRGARSTIEVSGVADDRPYVPLLLDPAGRRVAVRGPADETKVVDLVDGRSMTVRHANVTGLEPPSFAFTQQGDALIWSGPDRLAVAPLPGRGAGWRDRQGRVIALTAVTQLIWSASAVAAPMLWSYELGAGAGALDLVARRYPSRAGESAQLVEIGRCSFVKDEPAPAGSWLLSDQCDSVVACGGDWGLTPDGRELVYRAARAEGASRWWRVGATGCRPERLDLDESFDSANLLAALGRGQYVFAASDMLLLWRQGEVTRSLVGPDRRYHLRQVDSGRAVVLASTRGPTVRADADGISVLTIAQTTCEARQVPVVAPNGRWLAWSCAPDDSLPEGVAQGSVVRVSSAGLDRFEGVSMKILAVDNAGSVLMHSFAEGQGTFDPAGDPFEPRREPKTLYGLHADDVLDRLDDLEPTPAQILRPDTEEATFIQAVALP